jgi:hypothetical protein
MSEEAVLEFFGKFVAGLQKGSGANFTGYCPLHGEIPGRSKRSFSVNVLTGQWFCFAGCGGGGLPSLLKKLGKPSDYVDRSMERLKPHLQKANQKKPSVLNTGGLFRVKVHVPERILGLYESCPTSLLDAGFDERVLWDHDVGYDEERRRLTFPIRDLVGDLAGIMGRHTDPVEVERYGKYRFYTTELRQFGVTDPINKGDFLWRWDKVYAKYQATSERPLIYVAEGFKACLWMVQHGYEDTVALMGTSMSETQKLFLQRIGGPVVWCLDNNRAGIAGTVRNSYRLRGIQQWVLNYPESAIQPDDISPEQLHEATQSSLPVSIWRPRQGKQI